MSPEAAHSVRGKPPEGRPAAWGRRLVAAHQVDHLSWLGYFARLSRVDVLVDLDCVQYNHGRFQNRNRVVSPDGRVLWLTVPVAGGKRRVQRMADARIASEPWRRSYLETVRHAYHRHPYFDAVYLELAEIVSAPWEHLVELNRALRALLSRWLEITTPILSQSALGLEATGGEALLVGAVEAARGEAFLSGPTGSSFVDPTPFDKAGIELSFDGVFRSQPYPQFSQARFVPDLSALDLVMNLGPAAGGWLRANHA